MAQTISIKHGEAVYHVDLDDLTGYELGTLDRLRRDYNNIGVAVAVLLIGKQRAGEKVSEAELLKLRVSEWDDVTEPDEPAPPTRPVDVPPVPVT